MIAIVPADNKMTMDKETEMPDLCCFRAVRPNLDDNDVVLKFLRGFFSVCMIAKVESWRWGVAKCVYS